MRLPRLPGRGPWRLAGLAALLAMAAAGAWILWPLPAGMTARPPLGVTLVDRHGLPLRSSRAPDGSRAGWVPLAEMDPKIIQAFIALEDRRFFQHRGLDARAVARAARDAVRDGRIRSGASTITMQLARLLRPSRRNLPGKAAQAAWALRLELHLSKQEILEQYLNRVPLGQGTVGVAAAADFYFDASAAQLSLGQAALLAGLASSPSAANPFTSLDRAGRRRDIALRRLLMQGYATSGDVERAMAEPVPEAPAPAAFAAPHFTNRLVAWAGDSGVAGTLPTTLDAGLQHDLEAEVRHTVALLRESEVREGAVVVLDNASGDVLAWVGSPDFWADSAGQVDMVVSPRQPGSALKPFLYALAFDRGYTAASLFDDAPRTYHTPSGPYQPRNYDRRWHGQVRAREALASSFNIPAVDLTERLGAGALLAVLHRAGFASLTAGAEHYGLGLALGNGDVTLLELANGYRGLANGGVWRPVRRHAAADAESRAGETRFVSQGAALLVLDILSDPVARIPGFGTETPFDFPWPVAVKTGTSRHFTDNWAVGVTQQFTVAVWVGNFSGRPMRRISGVTGAGPLLHRAILSVARRYDAGSLPQPDQAGARRVRICRDDARPVSDSCPALDEWFLPGTSPAVGASAPAFRILSPRHGDQYQIPPGRDGRSASIALRAEAPAGELPLRWLVDGQPVAGDRWGLQAGRHTIQAVGSGGQSAEVVITVQ